MIPGARTVHGQLLVSSAAPSASDPRLGGFALTPIGEIYANAGSGAWTPAALFSEGEQGVWYDPSDLSTMFQDAAGTVPVTADGQPVGLILDKSGNGHNASQSTSTARPLYKTDGTYRWLQFDGIDDSLGTSWAPSSIPGLSSAFYGLHRNTASDTLFASTIGNSSTAFLAVAAAADGGNAQGDSGNPTYRVNTTPLAGSPVTRDTLNTGLGSGVNKVMSLNSINLQPVTWNSFAFGAYPSFPINGNIYSLIVRGAFSTPEEITETETWVNGKTGAY